MRRILTALACVLTAAVAATAEAHFDHPVPNFAPTTPPSPAINAGGREAEWELVGTIPTGNPHTDLDFFKRGGEDYVSVGTLANGPNAGGQTIVQLTKDGVVEPTYLTGHPSASCLSAASGVTGLQHDVEATPKGGTLLGAPNPYASRAEAQLIVDATDAEGRCHDQGVLGAVDAPLGGLEIVDVTNPAQPEEIGLTSHVGEAHTVNIDPKRPHIAFAVSADSVEVGDHGRRSNDKEGNGLDGFEVVDMSSCMNFRPGTTLQEKRDRCRPKVYRYRYPTASIATATSYPGSLQSCHEVEIYPGDRLACASITATILFDLKGAFDDRGTPKDFTDDKPRGTPLPCQVRETDTVAPPYKTRAMVTDCVDGGTTAQPKDLTVSGWLKLNPRPSLQGVRRIGSLHHMGLSSSTDALEPPFDSTKDIFVSHEAEFTGSQKHVLMTDERGGGIVPNGASCSPGVDNREGNGGIHAYPVSAFRTRKPPNARTSQLRHARTSGGGYAVYRAPVRTGPQGSFCTSHVMQQIPGQNRIFMGWYSQGTQVVDFVERSNGRFDFQYAGHFTPENANTWVSHIFKVQRNRDGSFTYWGATGDFVLAGTGRNAIDIYKVTLPKPPPAPKRAGTPVFPTSTTRGIENSRRLACARGSALEGVSVKRRGKRGLRFSFTRRGGPVTVELLRQTRGRRIGKLRRVKVFRNRRRSFNWSGRGKRLSNDYYVARFISRAPNGRRDVRRVALKRRNGRFRRLRALERVDRCGFVTAFKLGRSVFNRRRALAITFRLRESANVRVTVTRRGRRVKRFTRNAAAGRTHRIRLSGRRLRAGSYRVALRARRTGHVSQISLGARRLR